MRNPSDREESPWTRLPGGRRPRCALLRLPAAAPELARVPAPEVVPGRGEGRPVPPGRAALCSLGDSISESVGLCICCKLTATIKVDGTRQSITRRSYEKHRGQPPLLTTRLPQVLLPAGEAHRGLRGRDAVLLRGHVPQGPHLARGEDEGPPGESARVLAVAIL